MRGIVVGVVLSVHLWTVLACTVVSACTWFDAPLFSASVTALMGSLACINFAAIAAAIWLSSVALTRSSKMPQPSRLCGSTEPSASADVPERQGWAISRLTSASSPATCCSTSIRRRPISPTRCARLRGSVMTFARSRHTANRRRRSSSAAAFHPPARPYHASRTRQLSAG